MANEYAFDPPDPMDSFEEPDEYIFIDGWRFEFFDDQRTVITAPCGSVLALRNDDEKDELWCEPQGWLYAGIMNAMRQPEREREEGAR